jgi:hypothetical protein
MELMIKKILIALSLVLTFVGNNAYSQEKDILAVYFDVVQPSRAFLQKGKTGSTTSDIPNFYGFGLSFNQISIGWTDYFYDGGRLTSRYNFSYKNIASPYLGIDYVYKTEGIMRQGTKNINIDGVSPNVGINLNFFNIVKPYVQYQIKEAYLNLGVRIALPIKTNRTSTQDVVNKVEEDYIKEQEEEEARRAKLALEKEQQSNTKKEKQKAAKAPKSTKRRGQQ